MVHTLARTTTTRHTCQHPGGTPLRDPFFPVFSVLVRNGRFRKANNILVATPAHGRMCCPSLGSVGIMNAGVVPGLPLFTLLPSNTGPPQSPPYLLDLSFTPPLTIHPKRCRTNPLLIPITSPLNTAFPLSFHHHLVKNDRVQTGQVLLSPLPLDH